LANREQATRILVLCFNITLAAYLRSLIHVESQNAAYIERIEVVHFNGWARAILGRLPNPKMITENYDEVLGERLLEAIANLTLEQKWDAILVDEAHTFSPSWFKCCVTALKDPENGDLMIVSDGSQSLYQRGNFTWKSVGIKAQGRTKKLSKNYRNTGEILSAAWSVIQSFKLEESEEEVTFPVIEPRSALRNGDRPTLCLTTSPTQEIQAVVAQIQKLHNSGYEARDIAVLYRYKTGDDAHLLERLRQQLDDFGLGCYWVTENKHSYSNYRKGVRLITALSSLGLEFKAVLIPWVQQFGDRHSIEPVAAALARRQLYVAMTRAQEKLYLFGSGNALILHELRQSQHFEVTQAKRS
jgi:superfamily I DNA/RNA helicase